jgi:hypothetical protein
MHKHARTIMAIVAMLVLTSSGCDEEESKQMVQMAEKHLERQAEQNRQMSELHRQVADGANRLVEADAKAREEMVTLHRELQAERAEVGQQRDVLEEERRSIAAKRRWDPIIASAITNTGLVLACVLPLVLCWYLLHPRVEPADDRAVAEVLLQDLVVSRPLLLRQTATNLAIGFCDDQEKPRLNDDSQREGDPV